MNGTEMDQCRLISPAKVTKLGSKASFVVDHSLGPPLQQSFAKKILHMSEVDTQEVFR
jgi:hypothetical protein